MKDVTADKKGEWEFLESKFRAVSISNFCEASLPKYIVMQIKSQQKRYRPVYMFAYRFMSIELTIRMFGLTYNSI